MRRKERKIPPLVSRALAVLRTRVDWTQKELGAATGIPRNLISDYERGRKKLTPERLDFLLTTMKIQPSSGLKDAMRFLKSEEVREPDPPDPESRQIEAIAADSGRLMSDFTRSLMNLWTSKGQALEARQQARSLWAGLKRRSPEQRRVLVETVAKLRNWALSELLCEESIKAAGDSADQALELANLALRVAELIPGDEAWRQRVQGYAWAHVGNARRVKGDLPSADQAFGRFQRLWSAGRSEDSGLLDEVRLLDLEASLRRAQTRFPEALNLLERALAIDDGRLKGRLLLNKATVLEALGNIEEAVSILYQAAPFIYSESEPRLVYALQFNLAVNLVFLGEYEKAEASLPQLRLHAAKLPNSIDGARLRWLEGRIAAGQGDRKHAITIFSQVQDEFLCCGLVQDGALVSLELAVLYLEMGRTSEVRILARRMAPIFKAQGVHREVLAALKLFRDAAESESVTLELTQRLIDYLNRARYNPELRFQSP